MPRLDQFLHNEGFAASRSLAARLCREGYVLVNGRQEDKPSFEVGEEDQIEIRDNPLTRYVSRGGLKLEEALRVFHLDPAGKACVDIGASTGGFTDCLLQHGAAKVWAVDSGTDQLHPSLRENDLVVSLENVNARFLDESMIPPADLAVMDVSFISQSLLYQAIHRVLKPHGILISLIKPQFEVGRDQVGGGGIVRNDKARAACVEHLKEEAAKHGLAMQNCIPSPITGGDGNVEYLAWFTKEK